MYYETSLRQVGGSVAMVIPPAVLKQLQLKAGEKMQIKTDETGIQAQPIKHKVKYSLSELLAQSDFESVRDEEWLNSPAIGEELL